MKGNYLISTDSWFYAPDGKQYNAVWGNTEILTDSILGIKTNMRSTNWFAKIGTNNNHVIVAGCQVHYAVKCEIKPNTKDITERRTHEAEAKMITRECQIYIAE